MRSDVQNFHRLALLRKPSIGVVALDPSVVFADSLPAFGLIDA